MMAKQPREPEFARPTTGVKMPPEDDTLFGDEPTAEPEVAPPTAAPETDPLADWRVMPAEPAGGHYGVPPYDHGLVRLTLDGEQSVVAQWQTSRRWAGTGSSKRWEAYGFWAQRNTGGKPVAFVPKGWREWRG